jgi:SAM-dependent methyltransferase
LLLASRKARIAWAEVARPRAPDWLDDVNRPQRVESGRHWGSCAPCRCAAIRDLGERPQPRGAEGHIKFLGTQLAREAKARLQFRGPDNLGRHEQGAALEHSVIDAVQSALYEPGVRRLLSFVAGLGSPTGRVLNAQRLLAFTLSRIDWHKHLELAPRLPDEALSGSTVFADREAMLHVLPKGGKVAEVGVYRGEFSRKIAAICGPDEFHLIDLDLAPLGEVPISVETHEGDSSTILGRFDADYFDWIYIDADHSYDPVVKDLAAAHRVLKRGGYLACNDYANWCSSSAEPYGVSRAVNEFIIRERYKVVGLALHAGSLPDILIRKPS